MSYKRHNKSIALWFSAIGFFGLMVFGLLAGVAQAVSDLQSDEGYTSEVWLLGSVSDVSQDGKTAVVWSNHAHYGDGIDTNDLTQIYLLDIPTKALQLVSKSPTGEEGNHVSERPRITTDGKFVFYESQATNLVSETVDPRQTLYLFDRSTKNTTAVKLSPSGGGYTMSDDTRYVAYSGSEGNNSLVYLLDRTTNTTIPLPPFDYVVGGRFPHITPDGKYVIYNVGFWRVFRYDIQAKIATEIQKIAPPQQPDNEIGISDVSPDGQMVVLQTRGKLLPEDTNSFADVYLYNFATDSLSLVSQSTAGVKGNHDSSGGQISSDKRLISFSSMATNLDDTFAGRGVLTRDLTNNTTTLVSRSFNGEVVNGLTALTFYAQTLSKYVFFESSATNIVPNDLKDEVGGFYYYDTEEKKNYFVFSPAGEPASTSYSISGKVTDNKGNGVPFARITTNVGEYLSKSDGTYSIPGLSAGTYQITVTSTTMVFTPTVRAVVVPPNNTEASFTQLCVSPHTGIDVCNLEVGDILFYSHAEYAESIIAKTYVGTYWFHTALFAGGNYIVHSQGQQTDQNDDVIHQPIVNSNFWMGFGDESFDYAVLRPNASAEQKQAAVNYAINKAEDPEVTYVRSKIPDGFLDRGTDTEFSCSELVWKAYQVAGLEMEADVSLWRWVYPEFNNMVTPDDLYFTPHFGQADIVQQKEDNTTTEALKKVLFYLLSPADLLLTDSQGKRVGSNPTTGEEFAELPNAWHYNEPGLPEVIVMQAREGDTWTLQTTGTGEGNYTVQVVTYGATSVITQTTTLTTTVGKVDTFSVTLETGNTGNEPIKLTHESTTLPTDKKYIYLPLVRKK